MSDKSVAERLQIKGERRLAVLDAPAHMDDSIGVAQQRCAIIEADVVIMFAACRERLDANLPAVLETAPNDAIIWIAYPKLTSRLAGDLNRDLIRNLVAMSRLATVSQIAIDGDWSALRVKRIG